MTVSRQVETRKKKKFIASNLETETQSHFLHHLSSRIMTSLTEYMTPQPTTVQDVSLVIKIKGQLVDTHTRCSHYHTDVDVIAIKFLCCPTYYYYPCFKCHQESNNHEAKRYPISTTNEKAVLCGNCYHEMTIQEYLDCNYSCPACEHPFNPGCRNHYQLYFQ